MTLYKNKILIIVCILLLVPWPALCQDNDRLFNKNEIDYLAYKISMIQMAYDCNKSYFPSPQDSTNEIYKDATMFLYNLPIFRIVNFDEFNSHRPEINMNILFPEKNEYGIYTYEVFDDLTKRYVLSITNRGKIYLLHSFEKDDFKKFIIDSYNQINENRKALDVVKLYYIVKFNSGIDSSIIIDNNNINDFAKFKSLIRPLDIQKGNEGYKINFFTISRNSKTIYLNDMLISYCGDITFNRKIIKDSDTYFR